MSSSNYPKQLLENIVKNIHPDILQFLNKKAKSYDIQISNITELIEDVLMEYLKGMTAKEDTGVEVRKLEKNKSIKRKRWYQSYIKDLEKDDYNSLTHPLHSEYNMYKTMDELDFFNTYKVKNFAELVNTKKETAHTWFSDNSTLFINFPGIHLLTSRSVLIALKMDIMLSSWEYILNEFDGNINIMSGYPERFIEHPIFSPTSFTLRELQEQDDKLVETVTDDLNNTLLTLSIPNGKVISPYKVMDETDMKIVTELISQRTNSFYKDNTIPADLLELYKKVYPNSNRVNKAALERFEKRLDKLTEYTYKVYYTSEDNKGEIIFNFIDHIVKKTSEGRTSLFITFGNVISESIINNQLIEVNKTMLLKLENTLAQILIYSLQYIRIKTIQSGKLNEDITYAYMLKVSRFNSKNKQKNINTIKDALEEMQEQNVLIKNFSYEKDIFHIEFTPLSDSEAIDLGIESSIINID